MIVRRNHETVFRLSDETMLGQLLGNGRRRITVTDLDGQKVVYEKLAETNEEWELAENHEDAG